ncbi:YaaL family protein [Virgibacillus sp. MSP4-1]|uniref:YaaL family protein n=1 Tax=Virgibacillus sp. MSP4-1 TaxID=2700081 RepID=UPI00039AA345|nr:YaaL family protein [Virgibacillus sp. MSP4-1]QHS23862.1 YaaL family protein [Virgibacillus sp. MSP4-1]
MFGKGKIKKKDADEELIHRIHQLKKEKDRMNALMKNSVDINDGIFADQACTEGKYFFLLREARQRKIRGIH